MQLRLVNRASVTHQHVTKACIKAAINWGGSKPSREVNGQSRSFQLGQTIEMGRMLLLLLLLLLKMMMLLAGLPGTAKPTIIQRMGAHGRAQAGVIGMSGVVMVMVVVGRSGRGSRSPHNSQGGLINMTDCVGPRPCGA